MLTRYRSPFTLGRLRYSLARMLLKAGSGSSFSVVPSWVAHSVLNPTFRSLTRDGYQKSSAFFACVSTLAFAFPEPPVRVFDNEGDVGQPMPRHPLRLLLKRPMPTMGEAEILAITIVYLSIGGNAYWHKVRGRGGQVVALKPYHGGQIMAIPGGPNWIKWYEYDETGSGGLATVSGTLPKIPPEDIVHFKWPSVDPGQPWQSQPPIVAAASEVDSDVEATRYVFALLKNDAVPRTVLTVPADRPLMPGEDERIKAQFRERYGGENRGDVALLEAGTTAQRLSLNLQELAFEALARLPETRIAAALRVPPIIAGLNAGLERSTYSNYAEARRAFAQDTLSTLWRLIGSEITADLLPEFDGFGGAEARFDLGQVAALQDDATQRYNRTVNAWKAGLITRNEGRRMLGLGDTSEDGETFYSGGGGFGRGTATTQEPNALPSDAVAEEAPKAYVVLGDGSLIELPFASVGVVQKTAARLATEGEAGRAAIRSRVVKGNEGAGLDELEGPVERSMLTYLRGQYRKAADGVASREEVPDPDVVEQLGLDLGPGATSIMRRVYPKVLQRAFADAEMALDIDLAFDVENKEVQAVLGELADLVTRITETTRDSIRSLIGRAASEGWSVDRLAKEIRESGATTSRSRARMIARTETATAYSMGSLLAYAQSGVVDKVEWLATLDKTTCEDCKGLNGEQRPLVDAVFSDGTAHPPRHPNCRCALAPIVATKG